MRALRIACAAILCCAGDAGAQGGRASPEPQAYDFPARVAGETRQALVHLADSAGAAGLPVEPIVAKVAEGVLKGADDQRILRAARSLVRQLGEARVLLPRGSDAATLMAAVSALQAGASRSTLASLVSAGSARDAGDLALALVTLADVVASGVPAENAGPAVEELLRRGATPRSLEAFRSGIARDIAAGVLPADALSSRSREVSRSLDGRPARGVPPP